MEHPEATRSSIKFPGNLGNLRGLEREQEGMHAAKSRKEVEEGREVSVLHKNDTGNDAPGGQIHEMRTVSNL